MIIPRPIQWTLGFFTLVAIGGLWVALEEPPTKVAAQPFSPNLIAPPAGLADLRKPVRPEARRRQDRREASEEFPPAGKPIASWHAVFEQVLAQSIAAAAYSSDPDWRGIGILDQMMRRNPRLIEEIVSHCPQEERPEALRVLRMLLAGKPQASSLATRLASEGSAPQRKFAFDLLTDFPASAEANQLAANAFVDEQDPAVLASAIAALRLIPTPAELAGQMSVLHELGGDVPYPVTPADADAQTPTTEAQRAAIVASLQTLVQHESAVVRSQSLTALVNWDADSEVIGTIVSAGLSDQAADVRQAALAALVRTGDVQSFKKPLVQFLASDKEDLGVRAAAWQLLQNVPMSDAERALHDDTYAWLAASNQAKFDTRQAETVRSR